MKKKDREKERKRERGKKEARRREEIEENDWHNKQADRI